MSIGNIQKTQEIAAEKIAVAFVESTTSCALDPWLICPFILWNNYQGPQFAKRWQVKKKVSGLPFIVSLFKKEWALEFNKKANFPN